jgi:ankyrin repeat protein
LTAAIENGHEEIMKYLVSIGAPVNHRHPSGSFPLEEATYRAIDDCSNSKIGMVEFLL